MFNLKNIHTVWNTMYMLYRSWAHLLSDPFLSSLALLCVSGELTIANRFPRLPGHLGSSWAQPMRSTRGRKRPGYFSLSLLPLGDISDSSCSEAPHPRQKVLLWYQLPSVTPPLGSGHTFSDGPSTLGLEVTSYCH